MAPKFEIVGGTLNFTVQPSVAGRRYQLQYSETLEGGSWLDLGGVVIGDGNNLLMTAPYPAGVARRFFRLALDGDSLVPDGFALIPAGIFQMGDQSNPLVGESKELPVHSVYVSGFYMGRYEVTKESWDGVTAWGLNNGYTDLTAGNGSYASKGGNHPVHTISWYDIVKWCNARSQKEGLTPCYTVSGSTYKSGYSDEVVCNWNANGYRLPSEAEWEKAARGGLSGRIFPLGNSITHSQANYFSDPAFLYDVSPTRGYHPNYLTGGYPYSSPVGTFAPNGYGLHDMEGNMAEWCWDWEAGYSAESQTDPRGVSSGTHRVYRDGSWFNYVFYCRVSARHRYSPAVANYGLGFRMARSSVP